MVSVEGDAERFLKVTPERDDLSLQLSDCKVSTKKSERKPSELGVL